MNENQPTEIMDHRNQSGGWTNTGVIKKIFLNYTHSVHEDEKWDYITKSDLKVYKMEILELKLK